MPNQPNGGFFVATNRQKPAVNHFAERAARQREAEEAAKAKAAKPTAPTPAAAPQPDLEALKAAAAEAAALVHADSSPVLESAPLELLTEPEFPSGPESEPEEKPEPETKRGRPMSAAVMKRNATILQLLAENPEGLSKPQLASELKEKEANVYSSLRKLQSDGKVRMENVEGTKYLWYLA